MVAALSSQSELSDQLQKRHLGTCQKHMFSGPTPDLQSPKSSHKTNPLGGFDVP